MKWNEKLKEHSGKYISCNTFEKDGLSSEGYIVNSDGSLTFHNDLKNLDASSPMIKGENKTYWSSVQKGRFLKACQNCHKVKEKCEKLNKKHQNQKFSTIRI
jgi:hypothetical protein